MRPSYLVGAVVITIGIILLIQYWPTQEVGPDPRVQPGLPAAETLPLSEAEPAMSDTISPAEPPVPEPVITLPELGDSDAFVLEQISTWTVPVSWLQREDLMSRAAVIVQNAADGQVPRRQVSFLTPGAAYKVTKVGDRLFVDPQNYTRYDSYIDMLEAIPPAQLADFIDLVSPLMVDALARLGERRPPAELIVSSLARIEALPDLPSRIELSRPNVMFIYADPALEALPEFDKQLLRFGPGNLLRLRAYAAEFKRLYLLR